MANAAKILPTLIKIIVKPFNVNSLVKTIIKKKDQIKGGKLTLDFIIDVLAESQ